MSHAGREVERSRPDRAVLVAFAIFVVLAGANAIGVRFVLREMGPFWAAGIRFLVAGVVLTAIMVAWRRPVPRGEQLVGTVLFGVLAFPLAYLFLYLALVDAPAGTTMLMLAIVPLLTVLLAVAQGIERMRWLGLAGAVIAAIGIVIVSLDQLSLDVPLGALVLLVAAALCQAESAVVAKRFPPGDPVAANAIGQLLGGAVLAGLAIVTREQFAVPTMPETLLAMAYLIGPGSIVVFVLVLWVLSRWTASATSYGFLLFPLVAIVLGALLLDEPVRPSFVVGGVVVLAGVYLGALY
jgi:drug/metabolite transporter (DMT)-like permease